LKKISIFADKNLDSVKTKIRIILLICAIFPFCAFSQNADNINVHELKFHTGYVIQNWLSDSFPKRNSMFLVQYSFEKQTGGKKYWHQLYNFPTVGANIFFGDMGNPRELGYNVGVVPSITFNTANEKKWNLKLSLGIGLGYFNKPYNKKTNDQNILIGSHITNLSFAQLYFSRTISEKINLTLGIGSVHASNGHYQIPNVGLNAPAAFVGIKYYPQGKPKIYKRDTIPQLNKTLRLNIRFGIGVHEFAETTKPVGGPKYTVYTGIIYVSKRFGKLSNVQAGVSVKYYTDYYSFFKRDSVFTKNIHLKSNVISVILGHEFLFGHFTFSAHGCLDIYYPEYKPYTDFIQKQKGFSYFAERYFSTELGMQYYLHDTFTNRKNNFFIGTYINAHFGSADFIEAAVGWFF
jgi:hypothetical protein